MGCVGDAGWVCVRLRGKSFSCVIALCYTSNGGNTMARKIDEKILLKAAERANVKVKRRHGHIVIDKQGRQHAETLDELHLTAQQALFCEEYVKDLNQTQAAIRAGYSKHTATAAGSILLSKLNIHQRVRDLIEQRNLRLRVSGDAIISKLTEIAYSTCYREVTRIRALELLAKHAGMITDNVHLSGSLRAAPTITVSDSVAAELVKCVAEGNAR